MFLCGISVMTIGIAALDEKLLERIVSAVRTLGSLVLATLGSGEAGGNRLSWK